MSSTNTTTTNMNTNANSNEMNIRPSAINSGTLNRLNNTVGSLASTANGIALTTSSPLIAKYINMNNNLNRGTTATTTNPTTTSTTSSTTTTSTYSSTTQIINSSNKPMSSTSTFKSPTNPINDSTNTSTTTTSSTSILNPEGYLSSKLNQTRAAREAFLRGNNSTTTSSLLNSTTNTTMNNNSKASSSSYLTNSQNTNTPSTSTTTTTNSSNSINDNRHHHHHHHQHTGSGDYTINDENKSPTHHNTKYQNGTTNGNGINSTISKLIINGSTGNTNGSSANSSTNSSTATMNGLNHHNNLNDDSNSNFNMNNNVQPKIRTLDGYVGFVNLPNQVYRKSVKKGFEFNLMIIGETGLGKSTFINSLFLTELYNPDEFPGTHERRKKTVHVDSTTALLSEKGVNLRLTIVDTPGFGENVDNTNCWQPIVDCIDMKYEEYLNSESRVYRKPIIDDRIHCCLHFIAPGHTLKQLDIEVMKKLHDRVNLIPVIAKADTMTADEIKQFKKTILNEISQNKIQIYEFPDIDDDEVEINKTNNLLKSKLPFAIVGSNTTIEIDGKMVRGRQYPWGVVNIDDLGHCDFMALRTMLIRTHMQDLKDVTNNVHYENYRYKRLSMVSGDKSKLPNNKNPFQQLEEERKEAELRLEKMKVEMEVVFEQKVREKISRLKESEANLEKQQESMKSSLEKEERELEAQILAFMKEKQMWEEVNRDDEERLKQSLDKEADKKKKKIF